jgi:hypothetical protein
MPTRYTKDIVVDPATAALMSKAFTGALESLKQSAIRYPEHTTEWVRETLALRIIETVQKGGERDLERLREDALIHLAQSRPPRDPTGSGTG